MNIRFERFRSRRIDTRRVRRVFALACVLVAPVAGADSVTWTGNAPIYFAVNGSTVLEFQFALDWAGYCNANPAATCSSQTYWGSPGNWSRASGGFGIPSLAETVVIGTGQQVRIAEFFSQTQGFISGLALAGAIDASGSIEITSSGVLRSPAASVQRLFGLGDFINDGIANIGVLGGLRLGGTGVTRVTAFDGSVSLGIPGTTLRSGHTLEHIGLHSGVFRFSLEPQAVFRNIGGFSTALPAAQLLDARFQLQGTADGTTVPRVINDGSFEGSFGTGGVAFDNNGTVTLAAGESAGLDVSGTHRGRFIGAAGSSFVFGGSPLGLSRFEAVSSLATDGEVVFARGTHFIDGSYDAPLTSVTARANAIFSGSVAPMTRLHVQGAGGSFFGGRAEFTSTVNANATTTIDELVVDDLATADLRPGGDLAIGTLTGTRATVRLGGGGELSIDEALIDRGSLTVSAAQPSTIGRLELRNAQLFANSPLSIEDEFIWAGGALGGTSQVTARRLLDIAPGTLAATALEGMLIHQGTAGRWRTSIGNWSGQLVNAAGATLTLEGPFDATGTGVFVNRGQFQKPGTGRANLGVAVQNHGRIDVDAGTLALGGGGELRPGSFLDVAPGANVELRAGTGRQWLVDVDLRQRSTGRVEFRSGDVTFTRNGRATVGGNRAMSVAQLTLDAGAELVLRDQASFGADRIDNAGYLEFAAPVAGTGSYGGGVGSELVIGAGSVLGIGGSAGDGFSNQGTIRNRGELRIATPSAALGGLVDNDGVLAFDATFASISGLIDNSGELSTSGIVTLRGPNTSYMGLSNSLWRNTGLLLFDPGSRALVGRGASFESFGNPGAFIDNGVAPEFDDGGVLIDTGAVLEGNGSFLLDGGTTWVRGRLATAGGVEIRNGLLKGTGVVDLLASGTPLQVGAGGRVRPGNSPGTLTVLGDVEVAGDAGGVDFGSLEFAFDANGAYSVLDVSGQVRLGAGSRLKFDFLNGALPVEGSEYHFLRAGGGIIDDGAVVSLGLPAGYAAEFDGQGRMVIDSNAAVELLPLIFESNGLQRADLVVGGVVRHSGDAGIFEQVARLDVLSNAGQFHNRRGSEIAPTGIINFPSNPHGVLRIENAVGGSFINRGVVAAASSDGFGNVIVNDGRFENGSGARLDAGLVTNRGQFLNAGRIARDVPFFFGNEPRTTVINASDARFVNAAGGTVEAALFVNENRGRVEQNGLLALRGGVSEGSLVGSLVNRGEFVVRGSVEVGGSDAGLAPFSIENTSWDDAGNNLFVDPATGLPIPGPGGQPQGPVRFEIAASGRVTGADNFFQSAYFREVALHVDGLLETNNSISLNFGTLSGAGTLRAPDVTLAGVQLMPGNSPGTLLFDGDLVLDFSDIVIEVDSATVFDSLLVTGSARLNGNRLFIRLAEDFVPTAGFAFDWLTATGGIDGADPFVYWAIEQASTFGDRVLADSFGFRDPLFEGLILDLRAGSFDVSPVPLPPSALLLAGALLPLLRRVRRH